MYEWLWTDEATCEAIRFGAVVPLVPCLNFWANILALCLLAFRCKVEGVNPSGSRSRRLSVGIHSQHRMFEKKITLQDGKSQFLFADVKDAESRP